MGRAFPLVAVVCTALFGAILAGYWDMIDTEKLRAVRDQAASAVSSITATDRGAAKPAPTTPVAKTDEDKALPSVAADPAKLGSQQAAGATPTGPVAAENAPETSRVPEARPANEMVASREGEAGAPRSPDTSADPAAMPTFDVLRVEPDGSAVMAGRADPNANVRLMDGGKVIGTAKTTSEGAFAIALDDRLRVGDHQIRIEADGPDGRKTASVETAIVSIPEAGRSGELLAMVESPNKPSRLIAMPQATSGDETTEIAKADTSPATANGTSGPGTTVAAREETASVATKTSGFAASGPEGTSAAVPALGAFAVEAVEIENSTIYIAGRAPGADPVRVYVDDKAIGDDAKRANGRFLVTAKTALATGDHSIRVDIIGRDGRVLSRAEVPFSKPEGETMSAIASLDPAPPAGRSASQADTLGRSVTGSPSPAIGRDAGPSEIATDDRSSSNPSGTSQIAGAEDKSASSASSGPRSSPDNKAIATATPQSTDADAGRAAEEAGTAIATVQQPALESVNTRVLIRRGDTLWRISRNTYGLGRRYTVIYLANGDQIRNPHRIYPGQVFRLPKDEAPGASKTAIR